VSDINTVLNDQFFQDLLWRWNFNTQSVKADHQFILSELLEILHFLLLPAYM